MQSPGQSVRAGAAAAAAADSDEDASPTKTFCSGPPKTFSQGVKTVGWDGVSAPAPVDKDEAGSAAGSLRAASMSGQQALEEQIAKLKSQLEEAEKRADGGVGRRFAKALHLEDAAEGAAAVGRAVGAGAGGLAKALHLDDAARKLRLDEAGRTAARALRLVGDGPPTLLTLTVCSGRKLAAVDKKRGRSSPFCVFEIVDGQKKGLAKDVRKQRTRMIEKSVSPVWNERLQTISLNPGAPVRLRVAVYSAGLISDDFLGGCDSEVSPDEVLEMLAAPSTQRLRLTARPGQKRDAALERENGGSLGELTVMLRSGFPPSAAPRASQGTPMSVELHVMGATDLRGSKKMQVFAEVAVTGVSGGGDGSGQPRRTKLSTGRNPDFDDRFSYRIDDPSRTAVFAVTVLERKGGGDGDVPIGVGKFTLRTDDMAKALSCPLKKGSVLQQPEGKSLGLDKVTNLLPLNMLRMGLGIIYVTVRAAAVPQEVACVDTDQGRPGGAAVQEEEEGKSRNVSAMDPEPAPRGLEMPEEQAAPPWINPEHEEEEAAPWLTPQAASGDPAEPAYPHQAWCTGMCGGVCAGPVHPPPLVGMHEPAVKTMSSMREAETETRGEEAEPAPRERSSSGGYSNSSDLQAESTVSRGSGGVEAVRTVAGDTRPQTAGRGRRAGFRQPPKITVSSDPPASVARTHLGEWRGSDMQQCCSTADAPEGRLCSHSGGAIPHSHWSCCGLTSSQAPCAFRGFFDEAVDGSAAGEAVPG